MGRVIIWANRESYWDPITVAVWRPDRTFSGRCGVLLLLQKDSLFFKNTKLLYVDLGYADLALLFFRSPRPRPSSNTLPELLIISPFLLSVSYVLTQFWTCVDVSARQESMLFYSF